MSDIKELKDEDLKNVSGGLKASAYTLNYGDTFTSSGPFSKTYIIYVGQAGISYNLNDNINDLIWYIDNGDGYKKYINSPTSMDNLANRSNYEGIYDVETLDAMLLNK